MKMEELNGFRWSHKPWVWSLYCYKFCVVSAWIVLDAHPASDYSPDANFPATICSTGYWNVFIVLPKRICVARIPLKKKSCGPDTTKPHAALIVLWIDVIYGRRTKAAVNLETHSAELKHSGEHLHCGGQTRINPYKALVICNCFEVV